jgi:hypothetical protein
VDKQRLQFDCHTEFVQSMDRLCKQLHLESRAELLRLSIKFMIQFVSFREQKAKIIIEQLDGSRQELIFLV